MHIDLSELNFENWLLVVILTTAVYLAMVVGIWLIITILVAMGGGVDNDGGFLRAAFVLASVAMLVPLTVFVFGPWVLILWVALVILFFWIIPFLFPASDQEPTE